MKKHDNDDEQIELNTGDEEVLQFPEDEVEADQESGEAEEAEEQEAESQEEETEEG